MGSRVPQLAVSALTCAQLPAAVDLHQRLLPHGFFVELGPRFLTRYYRNYLESPHALAVAVADGEHLAGVLIGTLDHHEHAAWTTGSLWALGRAGAGALLRRPRLLRRFLRTRARRYARGVGRRSMARLRSLVGTAGRRRKPVVADDVGPVIPRSPRIAVLSHVYVNPDYQGRGLGSKLVDAFVAAAREAGAERAELVTLTGSAGAGAFYAARGWQLCEEHDDADGRTFETYALEL
jgi:ribosomal protein S18 acetylase RimI-like enzyme